MLQELLDHYLRKLHALLNIHPITLQPCRILKHLTRFLSLNLSKSPKRDYFINKRFCANATEIAPTLPAPCVNNKSFGCNTFCKTFGKLPSTGSTRIGSTSPRKRI